MLVFCSARRELITCCLLLNVLRFLLRAIFLSVVLLARQLDQREREREREREKFSCHIIISQHKYKRNDKFKQRQAARKEVPSQLAIYDNYNQ